MSPPNSKYNDIAAVAAFAATALAWTAAARPRANRSSPGPDACPGTPARIGRESPLSAAMPHRAPRAPVVSSSTMVREPRPLTAPLPHWQHLDPSVDHEYGGDTYDSFIVKRVFPHEIYAWEHGRSTSSLAEVARLDAWESHAVPPVHLAWSETGIPGPDGRRIHYALEDGHHRLAAASRARQDGGRPLGIPAMVTARWTPDERGALIGWRGMPLTRTDPDLPVAWNRTDAPLVVHVPERIESSRVWGTPQVKVMLPGGLASTLTLTDIADRLNGHCRPNEFLQPSLGRAVTARVTLTDVHGVSLKSGSNGTLHRDIHFEGVDMVASDWRSILDGAHPLRTAFSENPGLQYPLLEVAVQQSSNFVSEGL